MYRKSPNSAKAAAAPHTAPILYIALAALVALALSFSPAPAKASVLIDINKSTQRMNVYVDGVPTYNWEVSTGLQGYDTPAGTFTPFRMEPDHFSRQYDDAPMPHSIFFTSQGHAIHGTMDQRYMGRAASHGCVRLMPANAAVLYDLVEKEGMANTKIVISGTIDGNRPQIAEGQPRSTGPGWFAPRNYEPSGYSSWREERRARRAARRAGWN